MWGEGENHGRKREVGFTQGPKRKNKGDVDNGNYVAPKGILGGDQRSTG